MLSIKTIKSGVREEEEYYTEDEALETKSEQKQDNSSEQLRLGPSPSEQKQSEYYLQAGRHSEARTSSKQKQSECYSSVEAHSEAKRLTQAVWHGKGARLQGLDGSVKKSDFKDLFYGFKPGGSERIRGEKPNPEDQERLAEDFTLSAPKSVSMALHLGGDLRLFDAHLEAVREVLDSVEQRYATTRIQNNGNRFVVNTNNLTIALIPHHTSRDGDMQTHTHAVIMNGTMGPDGVWRSLQNDAMSLQGWLGNLYRQKLAHKVQALGYEIYETKDGFELKGLSIEDIEVFSKRSGAIVKKIQLSGLEVTPENRDAATLTTRKAKHVTQTLEEFQLLWKAEASAMGVEIPRAGEVQVLRIGARAAVDELESAIAHLSERSVSFRREDIYQYVFSHLQRFEVEELDREIAQHPSLIRIGGQRFTTAEALEQEIEIRSLWMKGQGKATPLLSNPDLSASGLKPGQAEAVLRTLISTDTHQIIHGLSGVGKTKALGEIVRQLQGSGIEVRGFSPTIDAAAGLQEELKIKTNTVEHLVLSKPELGLNQLWIIDEAGMMSARQMQAIGRKAVSVGARLLLVGDKGQNSSIEAGSPLRALIDCGATVHSIRQIIRQKNPIQKQAVELIANGNGTAALELLKENGYIKEKANRSERVQAIADQYLALSPFERKQTLIVTGTNSERLAINNVIRSGLKTEGSLGESVKTVQLISRQFTDEQANRSDNYSVGDYIRLNRVYQTTQLKKGQLYKVEKRQGDELLVSSYGGRLYRFNPSQYKGKEVFYAQEIEIAVGDSLRWTATDRVQGRINGKQITVASIEGTTMSVRDRQGQNQSVSLLQPLAVDYNLVSTSYRAQSKTQKRVIVSATSDPTSSREPFYVDVSRQTNELTVYTQDLSKLRAWVKRSNAQQNPVELIGKHYVNRNNRIRASNGNDERATVANRTTESRNQGSERNVAPTNLRDDRHDPILGQGSSKSVHQSTHRTVAESKAQRDERNDPETGQGNRSSLQQDQRQQFGLSPDEQLHERFSRTDHQLQEGVVRQRIAGITQRIDAAQAQLTAEFKGVDELALAIANYQSENSLVESLKEANNFIEKLDQSLVQATQAPVVETLSDALAEWRAGIELALAIATLDAGITQGVSSEAWNKEHKLLEAVLLQVQSLDILHPEMRQLASVVGEWQAEALVESGLRAKLQTCSSLIEQLNAQPSVPEFQGMGELSRAIADYQIEADLAESLKHLGETLNQLEHRQEMTQLAELVNSLQAEQMLVSSGLEAKLGEIAAQLDKFQFRATPYEFEGMQELVEAVTQRRADDVIAQYMAVFNDALSQVNLSVQHYPDLQKLGEAVGSLKAAEGNLQPEVTKPLQELSERLRKKQISSTPTPKKVEEFWSPGATAEPPSNIDPKHWLEWIEDSCIHPALAEARLKTIYGDAVYDRLLSEKLATLGSGQYVTKPMARMMQGYEQLASDGGWWVDSGVDPRSFSTLKPGEIPDLSLYGTFKPNNPRQDESGKIRKYENPRGVKKELFDRDLNFSTVPDEIAEQIYRKYGITPTASEKASGFWYVVYKHPEIPIYRTEGNKKDAAITSQGRVVISGQGVNAGYRAKDQSGDKLSARVLHPQLEVFAQPGREIRFAFDQDSKLSTILNVRQELVREAELLLSRGCNIYSLQWDHREGKGADDLIKNFGPVAFERADILAVHIEQIMKQHYRTKYNSIAKRVKEELGNISIERVDLEVYIRATVNGDIFDGARFVGESDSARALRQQKPETAEHYVSAISSVSGTYKRLCERDVEELDKLIVKVVEQQLVTLELESEKLITLENVHGSRSQKRPRL